MTPLSLEALAQPDPEERRTLAQTIGAMVRNRRRAVGMTLKQLAWAASVSQEYLCDIEHGRKWPRKSVAARIEGVLNAVPRMEVTQ